MFAAGTRTPSHAVCELKRRDAALLEADRSKIAGPELTYMLIALTDRPGRLSHLPKNCDGGPTEVWKQTVPFDCVPCRTREKVELQGTKKPEESQLSSTAKKATRAVVNRKPRDTKTRGTAKRTGAKAASAVEVTFRRRT